MPHTCGYPEYPEPWIPLKLELLEVTSLWCRCCKLNSAPLEEQYVLLTPELLLGPQDFLFWLADGLEVSCLFVPILETGSHTTEGDPEITVLLALFPERWDSSVHYSMVQSYLL